MSREIFRHSIIPRALFAFFLTIVFVVPSTRPALAQAVVMCRDRNLNVVPCGEGSSGGSSSRSDGRGGIIRCLLGGCGDDDDNSGPSAAEIAAQQRRAAAHAANDKGIASAKQGNWAAAVRFYKEALGYSPNDNVIRDNLNKAQHNLATDINDKGNAASTSGNYDDAIEYYKKALANDPNDKVIRNNLAEAQTNQAAQQREAQERGRKAEANQAERTERERRRIQEARASDQQALQERSRLEKEVAEKASVQMDTRLRGVRAQAQAALANADVEFDARKGRAEVTASGAYMAKNPDKVDGKTGWLKDALSTLSTTSEGQRILKAQAEQQDMIRQSNEKIAGITANLKQAGTSDAKKKELNADWSAELQKQAQARIQIDKYIKEAKKEIKIIEETVLVPTTNASTTSNDSLQKSEVPPPAPSSQPGQ